MYFHDVFVTKLTNLNAAYFHRF